MQRKMRRRIKNVVYVLGALVLISPILPFYLLRQGLEATVKAIDWLMEGRYVPDRLARMVDRLELWSIRD